jgi:hypothetical protein
MEQAAELDIKVVTGKTYRLVATWRDNNGTAINLAGRTLRMQVRRYADTANTLVDLDSALKGGITKVDVTGQFTAIIPADETATWAGLAEATYEVDNVNADNSVDPILKGRIEIEQGVIR